MILFIPIDKRSIFFRNMVFRNVMKTSLLHIRYDPFFNYKYGVMNN